MSVIVEYWWYWLGFIVTFVCVGRESVLMHREPPAEALMLSYQVPLWGIMALLWPITFPMLVVWWILLVDSSRQGPR